MAGSFITFFLDGDFNYDVKDINDLRPIKWMNMVGSDTGKAITLGYAPDEGDDATGLPLKEVMLRLGGSANVVEYVKNEGGVFCTFKHQ